MTLAEGKSTVRCCLIQLYSDLQPINAEPLSIEKLASALSSSLSNVFVQLYLMGTFQLVNERTAIIEEIIKANYDLIGLSCPQGTYDIASEILSLLSTCTPPQIILGHALPTILPEYFLLPYPRAFIVRGWGELLDTWAPSLDWCLLATGKIDALIYLSNQRMWIDPGMLAGAFFFLEAGGNMSNLEGNITTDITQFMSVIAASSPAMIQNVCQVIAPDSSCKTYYQNTSKSSHAAIHQASTDGHPLSLPHS